MVYDKARSGDPDYDDKVPPAQHGKRMTADDGTEYLVTDANGPTTLDGAHFNPDDHNLADAAGDNRPKPGEVATEASTVQVCDPASAPTGPDVEPTVHDGQVPWTPDETPASTPGGPGETPNVAEPARPARSRGAREAGK